MQWSQIFGARTPHVCYKAHTVLKLTAGIPKAAGAGGVRLWQDQNCHGPRLAGGLWQWPVFIFSHRITMKGDPLWSCVFSAGLRSSLSVCLCGMQLQACSASRLQCSGTQRWCVSTMVPQLLWSLSLTTTSVPFKPRLFSATPHNQLSMHIRFTHQGIQGIQWCDCRPIRPSTPRTHVLSGALKVSPPVSCLAGTLPPNLGFKTMPSSVDLEALS